MGKDTKNVGHRAAIIGLLNDAETSNAHVRREAAHRTLRSARSECDNLRALVSAAKSRATRLARAAKGRGDEAAQRAASDAQAAWSVRQELLQRQVSRLREAEQHASAADEHLAAASASHKAKLAATHAFLREWQGAAGQLPVNGENAVLHGAGTILGAQLRAARALLGLSQGEMARRLELKVAELRNFERCDGSLRLGAKRAAALREALYKAGISLVGSGFYADSAGVGVRQLKQRKATTAKKKKTARRATKKTTGKTTAKTTGKTAKKTARKKQIPKKPVVRKSRR